MFLSQCGVKKEEEKKIDPLKIRGKSFLSPTQERKNIIIVLITARKNKYH
jgi:hypothetical protein